MTTVALPWTIRELLPHAGRMVLLDAVVDAHDETLVCRATIGADHLFECGGEVGAWLGIELMAQAIAAWSGWQSRLRQAAPRVGYLLGTRRYDSRRARFAVGEELSIHVHRLFQADNGLAQFEARIEIGGEIVASAALNVFEPPENATGPADVP